MFGFEGVGVCIAPQTLKPIDEHNQRPKAANREEKHGYSIIPSWRSEPPSGGRDGWRLGFEGLGFLGV